MAEQEVSIDAVMSRRFELVEQAAIIAGRHKAELEPLNEELRLCELFVKDEMNKGGLQQVKTDAGMAYFTTKDSVKVLDMGEVIHYMLAAAPPPVDITPPVWLRILNHIQEHGLWGLLNNAVNKTAAKEIIEATKASPPGIEYRSFKDLSWRRGKG